MTLFVNTLVSDLSLVASPLELRLCAGLKHQRRRGQFHCYQHMHMDTLALCVQAKCACENRVHSTELAGGVRARRASKRSVCTEL